MLKYIKILLENKNCKNKNNKLFKNYKNNYKMLRI